MTFREKLKMEHPDSICEFYGGGCLCCPEYYGYESRANQPCNDPNAVVCDDFCRACWDREIPEPINLSREEVTQLNEIVAKAMDEPAIKDSGDRTEFATGAVRDMREGKGRCDLMPLDVVHDLFASVHIGDKILFKLAMFQRHGTTEWLYRALATFAEKRYNNCIPEMLLEVAKHFEEGAKKYGEGNWTRGIPAHCYIDSAVRHYLKLLRGDNDERHDRAFCWNLLCCIWTIEHAEELGHPELVSNSWKK